MTNDEPVPGMRSVRVRRKRLEERILQVLGACYFRLSYVEDWEWEVGVGGRGVSREGGHVYGKLGETHRGNACPRPESSARARAREYPLFPSPRKGDLPSFPSCQGVCLPTQTEPEDVSFLVAIPPQRWPPHAPSMPCTRFDFRIHQAKMQENKTEWESVTPRGSTLTRRATQRVCMPAASPSTCLSPRCGNPETLNHRIVNPEP